MYTSINIRFGLDRFILREPKTNPIHLKLRFFSVFGFSVFGLVRFLVFRFGYCGSFWIGLDMNTPSYENKYDEESFCGEL